MKTSQPILVRFDGRQRIEAFMGHTWVQHILVFLILVNAGILGLETNPNVMAVWGKQFLFIDHTILGVFIVEIVLLIYARRLKYFSDPWCVFDFVVVGIALIPATGTLSVLRALRVLRVLRLINKIDSMRKVVSGLLASLPGLGSVFGLIMIIFYVASVIATNLFQRDFPQWFGSLGESAYTLFQIMTLEGWSQEIARPVMEVFPYAWVFFIFFILIATFVIFNLFIAIIVDSITTDKEQSDKDHKQFDAIQIELHTVLSELKEVRKMLEKR
ncbi:MAG: ion transporter [Limnohabitans sp.]